MLGAISEAAGRSPDELTRRDVALAMLAKPAGEALAELFVLRRELMAAGNPLSSTFWASAEAVLSSIRAGTATQGDVREWLEATGTEPIQLVPGEMFLWPDEGERGPVAAELHALLVAHLEALVVDGVIDPDRLAVGDAAALAAYRQIQVDWLRSPLPDGRVPAYAVTDEEVAEFVDEWDDVERDARRILGELLEEVGPRECPDGELRVACARLRDSLGSDDPWLRLLRAAAGVDPASLPDDDREAWLTLAAGVVAQQDEAPDDVLDQDSEVAWMMLEHSDWIATAVVLARGGPGTAMDLHTLSRDVAAFDFDVVGDDALEVDVEDDDALEVDVVDDGALEFDVEDEWLDEVERSEDDARHLSLGLFTAVYLWRVLGAIDEDDRLTDLGWWGLPESVLHAWRPRDG